jgi:hypothetical protein
MKNTNKTGLTPEQYRGLEILTNHGMDYVSVGYGTPNLVQRGLQFRRKSEICSNPKHLRNMKPGMALIGVVTEDVDLIVLDPDHPEARSDSTRAQIVSLRNVIAAANHEDGTLFIFRKLAGESVLEIPKVFGALSRMQPDCWVELPGSIHRGRRSSHVSWITPFPVVGGDL